METSQKVVRDVATRDVEQIKNLVQSMKSLVKLLNSSHYMMQSLSNLAEVHKTVDIVTDGIIQVKI